MMAHVDSRPLTGVAESLWSAWNQSFFCCTPPKVCGNVRSKIPKESPAAFFGGHGL